MSEPTLRECPFCGDGPYIIEDDSYGQCCVGCNCEAEPAMFAQVGKLDDAIALWNRRAPATQAPRLAYVVNPADYVLRATDDGEDLCCRECGNAIDVGHDRGCVVDVAEGIRLARIRRSLVAESDGGADAGQ